MNHIDARELGYRASYWGTNSGHWGPGLMWLAGLAHGRREILEIGVWCGGSTRAMLTALQLTGGNLTSIDIDPECRTRVGDRERWDFRCGDSIDELIKLHKSGYRCDFALVDGNHTYEYAAAELRWVDAMLEDGGIIVVDDVFEMFPGVIEAFHQFNPRRPVSKTLVRFGWDEETVAGGDKRTFGIIEYREQRPVPSEPRKLTIGVMTHPASPMPNACRETWIPRARELGIEVLFYSGAEPCEGCGGKRVFSQDGDTLRFPVQTDYAGCSDRADAFAKWMRDNRPGNWLFDVDDDTLVLPDRLLAMLPKAADYMGFALDHGETRYASGGAGMLLSPTAVGLVASKGLPSGQWIDDVLIGRVLGEAGIVLTEDRRFRPFRNSVPGDHNEPTRGNDFITGHCKSPGNDPYEERVALMRKIWKEVA